MQLGAGTAKDLAIASFSRQLENDDPADAYSWSESIGDAGQRASVVDSVLSRWMQQDPGSAAAAVQKSSLSDERKNQLLKTGQH